MTLTGTQARYELVATANASAVNTSGGFQLGTALASVVHTTAPTQAYSLAMNIQTGQVMTLNAATGDVTATVVVGVAQVETATIVAAAGATTAGDLSVTVTSALVTGSPLLISVALALTDNTATLVATKVIAALNAESAITDHYTVGGTGATYTLTTKSEIHAPNDSTLNMAHANGTCAGITTASSSANTTAGVGTNRPFKYTGATWNSTDYEGRPLPTMTAQCATLLRCSSPSASVLVEWDTNKKINMVSPFVSLQASTAAAHPWLAGSISFTATGIVLLYIDVHAI